MQEHRAYYGYAYGDKMKSLTSGFPDEVASLESVYDGLGKLRRVTDPAGATWYRSNTFAFEGIYGEGASEWDIGELGLALVNQPGQQAGPPLALRFPGDPDPFYIHYFLDNIQSARRLRLDDRTEMGANEYTPYGEFYHTSGLDGLYKFAGHIHDNANGMYWAPFRWYDPQVARWTTRDPLGMVDGPNVYAYAIGNPVGMVDLFGTDVLLPDPDWLATLWDLFRSGYNLCTGNCRERATQLARENRARFPGESDYMNHMRHCTTSCQLSRDRGGTCAQVAGIVNEFQGQFAWRDIRDNQDGLSCAGQHPYTCRQCCRKLFYDDIVIHQY